MNNIIIIDNFNIVTCIPKTTNMISIKTIKPHPKNHEVLMKARIFTLKFNGINETDPIINTKLQSKVCVITSNLVIFEKILLGECKY